MVTHESHFQRPCDYRTYTRADVPFMIVKGEDGKIRAFHNVCRHRAYTVARKASGNTRRLACKYHGWQYDTTGCLVKAPEFTDKPEFDISTNGLFEIHLRTDSNGFIFVNFATNLTDAFPWSDVSRTSLRTLSMGDAVEWELEIDVKWIIASKPQTPQSSFIGSHVQASCHGSWIP